MQPILIIEDDPHINAILTEALTKEGYVCTQAFSGTEALLQLSLHTYSLVLLDLMLPGASGEQVLMQLRTKSSLPVIVLTANDALDEKVTLLQKGADDYITKPFALAEVLARVQVQLRRAGSEPEQTVLRHKELTLDKTTFTACVHDEVLPLTRQEFAILELLLQHPRQVFSKEAMFEYAWTEAYMGETKTLDVHISNIRKKLKSLTLEPYIETVWGIGYRLAP